jgi:hypothetical protein
MNIKKIIAFGCQSISFFISMVLSTIVFGQVSHAPLKVISIYKYAYTVELTSSARLGGDFKFPEKQG